MHVVICHQLADFDGLGAAVGLTRLQAGTRIVLAGGTTGAVRKFLALHRDELAIAERRSIDPSAIQTLTIVDTQKRARLGILADWLDLPQLEAIEVYDHHPGGAGDIAATHAIVEPVGAISTVIVEKLAAADCQPSPLEATALALGIHADTGSLTFEHTTLRDARALTQVLEWGANLQAIREYAEPGLSPMQQEVLQQALQQLQRQEIQGYTVTWVEVETAEFVADLASVAGRLLELTEGDALIFGHRFWRSGHARHAIVGRSRIPQTDLNELLAVHGGGGHPQAAAVSLPRDAHGNDIFQQVLADFKAQIPQPPIARALMSSPVRTIRPETTIADAQRLLLRYGHSGLSVVDARDALVGIVSRRDLDIALHHGFGHARVKGYMSRNLKTITPTTPLPEIEGLMVTHDVGRLPVLDGDRLVGIVTRTDVLREVYREQVVPPRADDVTGTANPVASCLLPQLRDRLPAKLWELLARIAEAAQNRGWHLYLVGGGVRDLLLAPPGAPLELQDIDLVVDGFYRAAEVGAGVELAKTLQADYPEAKLEIHGEFQTAALCWPARSPFGPLLVDVATARTEFYPYPTANPEVEASSIRQDLYRRDFAVNALALCLTAPTAGTLLDFFGGLLDLKSRQIRVLHANSFIEDPTRIYRAARFAVRLDFTIEPQTEAYIRYAIDSGIYETYRQRNGQAPALQTRLKAELKYILQATYWLRALQHLGQLGALRCLHPQLEPTSQLWQQLQLVAHWVARLNANPSNGQFSSWQLRLEALLAVIPARDRAAVAANLQLPAESIKRLAALADDEAAILDILDRPPSKPPLWTTTTDTLASKHHQPSQIAGALKSYKISTLILVGVRAPTKVRQPIWRYLSAWMHVKPALNGNDLKVMGYEPGPHFKTILELLLAAALDGRATTPTAAKALLADRYPHGAFLENTRAKWQNI
ncbi:MAG: CBS domain-containing protein [Cyanobacteria bacterium J06641_5]